MGCQVEHVTPRERVKNPLSRSILTHERERILI